MSDYSRFKYNSMPLNKFFDICELCGIKLPKTLLVTNKTGKSEPIKLPKNITPKLAYILGAMVGDGHIGNRSSKHGKEVVYSELSYDHILKKFETAIFDVFGIKAKKDKEKGLIYYSTALALILNKLGIPLGNKAKSVKVPNFLFNESDESILNFVAGLFNADGDAHKNMLRIATTSKDLANGLRWLLLCLGIVSSIEKRNASYSYIQGRKIRGSKIFIVIISGRKQLKKLLESSSFSNVKSNTTLKQFISTKKPYTRSKDVLPVRGGLREAYLEHRKNKGSILDEVRISYNAGYFSTTKLSQLLPKLNSTKAKKLMEILKLPVRWVKIKSIDRIKWKGYVYDLTIENYHNFVSNLLLSHNTVENDIINNKLNLEEVSLLIFDEAHRAVGDYSYNFIAKQYEKLAKFPRILALTASPGSEMDKIEEVCKNLYIEEVEIRTDKDPDVKPYIQEVDMEWIKVELPDEFLQIKKFLEEAIRERLQKLKSWGILRRADLKYVNKKDLLLLQGEIQGRLAKGERDFLLFQGISLLAEVMKLEHALELLETQDLNSLYKYMDKLYKESGITKVKAVKNIVKDLNFKSAFIMTNKFLGIEHPKLIKLKEIIKEEIKDNGKIIVFNQYRNSALKIEEELNKIENVNAKIFVGQIKKEETGLTQKKQLERLQEFREGKFNVLIATAVGEEGLDIPQVDLVVFYEPIPSAIRSIQRRGRTGRLEKGKVIVLSTDKTRDEAYKWVAFHKEKKMYRNLEKLRKSVDSILRKKSERKLTEFSKIKVFADYREKASGVIKELIELGAELKLDKLEAADYILSNRVAIEYKTKQDFIDSLCDGRLLQQVKNLKQNYDIPLILVEGEEDIYSLRKVHPNAIRGLIASINVDFNVPIIYSRTNKESAEFINIIAKREQEEKGKDFSLHGERKPLTLKEQQEYIISALPGIGITLAKPLLKKFKTVKRVINASEESLQKVELIGEKKAKAIKDVVEGEYNE